MSEDLLAEPMVVYGENGPQPVLAVYRLPCWAMEWRRFVFWLDPCARRPWRFWYWTGLCHMWQREASREEYARLHVTPEWADANFGWDWRGQR